MQVLDLISTSNEPLTLSQICERAEKPEEAAVKELDQLIEEGLLKTRVLPDGVKIYWASALIPGSHPIPIVTVPFSSYFDHQQLLDRLSDTQLAQEKAWLQSRVRKLTSDADSLRTLANSTISQEKEEELDELIKKWRESTKEMLEDLLANVKGRLPEMTMGRLIKEMQIDPDSIGWNPEEQDFE